MESLGIIESFSVASLIEGADAMAKSANVRLLELRLAMALGGKAFATCTGSVAAVEAAVEAGARKIAAKGLLVNKVVIANPRSELQNEMIKALRTRHDEDENAVVLPNTDVGVPLAPAPAADYARLDPAQHLEWKAMQTTLTLLFALIFGSTAFAGELFRDDFSKLPPRVFSAPIKTLNNAIQEYHYLAHRGVPTDPWEKVISHDDAWLGGDEDGKPYLEQHTLHDMPELWNPTMITGDIEWSDYTVEVKVKPLLLKEMAGVVFRYHTNRHYYLFGLRNGNEAFLRLRLPLEKQLRIAEWKDLGEAEFIYDSKHYYTLKVENDGPRIRAYIDGKLILEATDGEILKGRTGVTANIPARFRDFVVSTSDANEKMVRARIAARDGELKQLRAGNPQPKLWKKFSLRQWGAGRNARFGDLDGDGQIDMLIAQNVRHADANSFAHISSLAAFTFDGKLLWTLGRPDPYNDVLCHDTPFQIHDIDGDSSNEVVMVRDLRSRCSTARPANSRTGPGCRKPRKTMNYGPTSWSSGDSIAFLNFSGKQGPARDSHQGPLPDLLGLQQQAGATLEGPGQLGHFPYPLDIDDDGKDEMVIGYALWDDNGKKLWSHDSVYHDHSDGIVMGNFSGRPERPGACLLLRQRRRLPDVRPQRERPEAHAHRSRPEPFDRQVPHGCARPPDDDHQLLGNTGIVTLLRLRMATSSNRRSRSIRAARCSRSTGAATARSSPCSRATSRRAACSTATCAASSCSPMTATPTTPSSLWT